MSNDSGLQFFVLDFSVIILTAIVLILCVAMFRTHRRYIEQKKFNEAMEKTVDRILKIEESGGIDGWSLEMQEKKTEKHKHQK